jgi:hypothetical protein
MGGNSGIPARYPNESVFVADYDPGTLDTPFDVVEPKGVVTASIKTTRYVGPVDGSGFLVYGDGAVRAGRLAGSMLLTIRARVTAFDASGVLGQDGASRLFSTRARRTNGPWGRFTVTSEPTGRTSSSPSGPST